MGNLAKFSHETPLPLCDANARALLSQISNAVWFYDPHAHRVRWANPAALQFWNAPTIEALAQRDFSPSAHGTADHLDNMRRALQAGGSISERWTLYPAGQPRQLDCRFWAAHYDDLGVGMLIEGRFAAAVDGISATELRAVEAVRQTPMMISLFSTTGHWLLHNPAATILMDRLELHNIPSIDNYAALFNDPAAAIELRERAIKNGSAHAKLKLSGPRFQMHDVQLRRLNDPVTGKLSLMLIQQDITREHRLERRLQKALERERTIAETQRHFLSLTSHEFRTPLSIIDGSARRIALLGSEATGEIAERLETIRNAVRRMSLAVDKTLEMGRIADGQYQFTPLLSDISIVIARAVAAQHSLFPDRKIDIAIARLPMLWLDPDLVEQVLENLLTNAIKYSPADQPIKISVRQRGGALRLAVTDFGMGIPAEDQPKLFTRFFRGQNVNAIKGSGVGLHAVRFFMGLHGGNVKIKSREGIGTTVTLRFPISSD